MGWRQDYERKKLSLDQVFSQHLTGGQKVYFGGLHVPTTIINDACRRVMEGSLDGLDVYGNWFNGEFPFGQMDVTPERFRYHTYFAGPNERAGFASGCVTHIPVHFSDTNRMLEEVGLDYAVVQMTPPDENGVCNIGPLGFEQGALRGAKHILAQVNSSLPRVNGDSHGYHVDLIDGFFEQDVDLEDLDPIEPTADERAVAALIVDRVPDGATIQLGIGGVSTAIAQGLACKKHLGAFTEMYSDDLAKLQEAGVIDNSRKSLLPGVSVGGYSTGSQHLYDFIDQNPEVYYCSYDVVCNPATIAQNDNLVSINTAISIDLTGQVCAESIGPRQYSASGGQCDFVRGVKHSKGGQGFIAITSVAHTKQGPVSKIVPLLAEGSAVTSLRNDVQFVATEYGVADLRWADIPTRAARLIAIAHPDFREQLAFEAKRLHLLY